VHGRRGRAPKTPTLLDVVWVRGRLKLQNHERSLPRVLDSNLRVTASPTRVSLGVASCQSEILSLKKVVWRLWLVSKSRTKSSAEGCEQLLRRAANIARLPSSPSHARTARRRLQATREIPPAISIVEVLRAFSCAAPCQFEPRGTTPVEGGLSSGTPRMFPGECRPSALVGQNELIAKERIAGSS
jgi:hypothetical protein